MKAITTFNGRAVIVTGLCLTFLITSFPVGVIHFAIAAKARVTRLILAQEVTDFATRQSIITNLCNRVPIVASLVGNCVQVAITAICFSTIRITCRGVTGFITGLITFYRAITAVKNVTRNFGAFGSTNRA